MFKTILLFLAAGASAWAQPVNAGLKAGVPLIDALTVTSTGPVTYEENTHRYIVGPYVELHLPARLSIEVDALYRSFEFREVSPASPNRSVGSWEFPVLAKFRLLPGPIRPYIDGGVAFDRLTNIPEVVELNHRNNYGIVVGGGLEFHLGFVRIAPEIRYEGWTLHDLSSPFGALSSNRNQATFLVGFGF